jgi:hypothetical protein
MQPWGRATVTDFACRTFWRRELAAFFLDVYLVHGSLCLAWIIISSQGLMQLRLTRSCVMSSSLGWRVDQTAAAWLTCFCVSCLDVVLKYGSQHHLCFWTSDRVQDTDFLYNDLPNLQMFEQEYSVLIYTLVKVGLILCAGHSQGYGQQWFGLTWSATMAVCLATRTVMQCSAL